MNVTWSAFISFIYLFYNFCESNNIVQTDLMDMQRRVHEVLIIREVQGFPVSRTAVYMSQYLNPPPQNTHTYTDTSSYFHPVCCSYCVRGCLMFWKPHPVFIEYTAES